MELCQSVTNGLLCIRIDRFEVDVKEVLDWCEDNPVDFDSVAMMAKKCVSDNSPEASKRQRPVYSKGALAKRRCIRGFA